MTNDHTRSGHNLQTYLRGIFVKCLLGLIFDSVYRLCIFIGFAILLACQLTGEVLARALRIPLPGPVIGMVLLFGLLFVRPIIYTKTQKTSHVLLRNLSLFFVPAGVGIMTLSETLGREGGVLVAVIVVSTTATALISAWCSEWLIKRR